MLSATSGGSGVATDSKQLTTGFIQKLRPANAERKIIIKGNPKRKIVSMQG